MRIKAITTANELERAVAVIVNHCLKYPTATQQDNADSFLFREAVNFFKAHSESFDLVNDADTD